MKAKRYPYTTVLLLVFALLKTAPAQTFTVLHAFKGSDGASPEGALVLDTAGNIYGTTVGGGSGNCSELGMGCGTAFMLNKAGKEVGLYSFKGANGYGPMAGLLRDAAGNFYGTTINGGEITDTCGGVAGGCGVAFRLTKTGKEVLYKFKGTPDGYFPESPLVKDVAGNFYGTTYLGGTNGLGAVFKIDAAGKEAILYSFAGPPGGGGDGAFSREGVIRDTAGNLYGVADAGAYGAGVVYKLDASSNETLLYNFTGGSDGGGPDSVLLRDPEGNLYGTTTRGGNLACQGGDGCGVIFKLSPQPGGAWTEAVLYTFCSLPNCTDGDLPGTGPLAMDAVGNIYGTTYFGGMSKRCNGDTCGLVFKLDTTGHETVLHSFAGGADGALPVAGLTLDGAGNLYGTTQIGGATCYTSFTCGVVFKITP